MFAVLVVFVGFIHFFINGFRQEQILNHAQDACFVAARNFADADYDKTTTEADLPSVPRSAYKVSADQSGYVARFRLEQNVTLAEKMDVCVRYNRHIGEFVAEGTVLAHVWDANTHGVSEPLSKRVTDNISDSRYKENRNEREDIVEEKLGVFVANGIVISKKRSSEMDVTLAIQQLSDTAIRALSPGINDPQTAIQCMDVLAVVLGRLIDMELGLPSARDKEGKVRLWGPRRTFSYMLSMLDPIRHYGQGDLAIYRRGIRLCGDLGAILTRRGSLDSRILTVFSQMDQWLKVAKQNFTKQSPELISIQALYNRELENISVSEFTNVQEFEDVEVDRQQMMISHNDPDDEQGVSDADGGVAQMIIATLSRQI